MKNQYVALVEDNEHLRMMMKVFLEAQGAIVDTFKDGLDFIVSIDESLEAENPKFPDLLILDLMMPRLSGEELLKKLKEKGWLSNTKKIVLTAANTITKLKECLGHGADDYLIKPVDLKLLKEKIGLLFKSRKATNFYRLNVEMQANLLAPSFSIKTQMVCLTEIQFYLESDVALPISARVLMNCPKLKEVMEYESDFYIRIQDLQEVGGKKQYVCSFIGLNETYQKKLRAIVIQGRELSDIEKEVENEE